MTRHTVLRWPAPSQGQPCRPALDRGMRHRRGRGGPVPKLLVRREPDTL